MGQEYRPLFELIIEESRRKAWESDSGRVAAFSPPSSTTTAHEHAEAAAAGALMNMARSCKQQLNKKKQQQKKKPKFLVVGRWLTARARPQPTTKAVFTASSLSSSPSPISTLYESAHDTTSLWNACHDPLNMPSSSSTDNDDTEDHHHLCLSLPCLQDDGDKYLELAVALDMMELCATQARIERDAAIAQASDLRFAIDTMRSTLHKVEQHCLHLNYQLFMNTTSTS